MRFRRGHAFADGHWRRGEIAGGHCEGTASIAARGFRANDGIMCTE